ncbi:GntR family transcriptional regulator [Glacieibacterium frigidum]|uniref:GntR family transcriptional regulator n=1 Tax=Glacieibacterium frigidum TaxID=2593303 RepID=A0A552UAB6_9SPHN|nr:GntR family transcriptional regulator [Glacieibacterium frigidum]TRW15161.1 GntR family transcriptional regulator [Glacieibacterium frigidum]
MSKAADTAYRYVRGEILSGALGPGAPLREEALAVACGVSRTPVREALRRLEAERFIQRSETQRSYVATLSPDDIAEGFALRTMLEGHAAARAAARIAPEQIEAMAAHNAAVGVAVGGATVDTASFVAHNRAFHQIVTDAAGSERLAAMLATVVEQPIVLRTARHYDREAVTRSHAEHDELILAFRRRDAEWARAVMTAHIRRAFHAYDDAFRQAGLTGARTEE